MLHIIACYTAVMRSYFEYFCSYSIFHNLQICFYIKSDHFCQNGKSGFTPLHIAAHYGNVNVSTLLLNRGAAVNFTARNGITPLHVASKRGNTNMISLLLDQGGQIDAKTRDGLTPLHCAARSGHAPAVEMLLERGAPLLARTKNGLSPLHMSAQGDHVECVKHLLQHQAPVDDVTLDYLTALHVAAHCGHYRVTKLLLDKKANPNARALNGFTPLHIACKKNRVKVMELLVKYGAAIQAITESGLTPIHVSAFMGHLSIVLLLLQNGASPDICNIRGETALHMAARAGQLEVVRCLLRNGAQVDAIAREEQTPLHIAARLGKTDIVQLLLQHMAHPDASTASGYTPLHISARENQLEAAAVLLEAGASHSLFSKKGFTPLHVAAKYGSLEVAKLLLQRRASLDAAGSNGLTPLHVAAHYDNQEMVLLLLDKGASPHATAKNGYTPLHIAARKNQMDVAAALIRHGASTSSVSKQGVSPLHLASQEGHATMASLLLRNNAHVNAAARNGLTPLHLAAQEDKVSVAEILTKNGANIEQQTKMGYTPLIVACHYGNMKMVNFLLQHDVNVNVKTKNGYTPLHQAAQQGNTHIISLLLECGAKPNVMTVSGNTALSIAKRLGYISVVDTLKMVTEEVITTSTTVTEKHKLNVPETMTEVLDVSDEEGEDTMMGDGGEYLRVEDLRDLGDDSLSGHYLEGLDYLRFSLEGGQQESSNRSQLTSRQQQRNQKGGALMEDIISSQKVAISFENQKDSYRLSWGIENLDNVALSSGALQSGHISPFHELDNSSFLVSFMVDARGGAMRGCRHHGLRIIVPPRKCSAPTRVTCRLVKRQRLACMPPLVEGEALANRLVEVGPTGTQFLGKLHLPAAPPPLNEGESLVSRILQLGPPGTKFLGPVVLEIPHFAALRGAERELVTLRSETGENWREHHCEHTEEELNQILNGMDEELDPPEELERRRICRIITRDFPQYFAVVSRIKQDSHLMGPEGGVLRSSVNPEVQAVFPEGALTKRIRVGLQAQIIPPDLVKRILGNKARFSPIVTMEPRRRKFHKPITMTIPVPKASANDGAGGYGADLLTLRLLCSITGGTTPAQWEDITGSTPLSFNNECVSFTTNVSARFWLIDCRQVQESVNFCTQVYRDVICVPYMAKFVIFAKTLNPIEARLRCFCMTDDKMDKTLEQQENFTEVARSRDVEVLEGKPIYADCFGNLVPLTKTGQHHIFSFFAFKENRLALLIKVRDSTQDPCGRLSFTKEPRSYRSLNMSAICNLNITLPAYSKDSDSDPETDEQTDQTHDKYDQDSESTETSFLKSQVLCHSAALASPDLSDMSELKQDVIKLPALLTVDFTGKSIFTGVGDDRETEGEPGRPFEIVVQVREDLETVGEMQKSRASMMDTVTETALNTMEGRDSQDIEKVEENVEEAPFHEIRIGMGYSKPNTTKDVSGIIDILREDLNTCLSGVVVKPLQEDIVKEEFTQVILSKVSPPEIKKPARRKLRERMHTEQEQGTSFGAILLRDSSDELLDDDVLGRGPDSPAIVETPIGSIKDKVQALQKKVEEEENQRRITTFQGRVYSKSRSSPSITKKISNFMEAPSASQSSVSDEPEEAMSVRELMKVFQSGQGESNITSGLFQHKIPTKETQPFSGTVCGSQSKEEIKPTPVDLQSGITDSSVTDIVQIDQVSMHSVDFSETFKVELEENAVSSGDKNEDISVCQTNSGHSEKLNQTVTTVPDFTAEENNLGTTDNMQTRALDCSPPDKGIKLHDYSLQTDTGDGFVHEVLEETPEFSRESQYYLDRKLSHQLFETIESKDQMVEINCFSSDEPVKISGESAMKAVHYRQRNHALSLEEEDVPSGHKPSESWQPSNDTGDTILNYTQSHALSLEEEDVPSGHKPSESWQPSNDTGDTILNYTQSHALSLEEEDVPSGHKPSESWQPSNDTGDTILKDSQNHALSLEEEDVPSGHKPSESWQPSNDTGDTILNDSQNHALSLEEEDVPSGHKPSESWQPTNDTGDTILNYTQSHALSLEEEDVPSGHKPSESWQPTNDTGDTILNYTQSHALSLEEEDVPLGHKPSESWQPSNDTGDTILNDSQNHALSLEEEDVPSGHKPSESWQPTNDTGDTILNYTQSHALSLEEEDVPSGHKPSESWQPSNDTGDTILKDSQNHALSLEEEDVPSGHKPSESWQPTNDTGDTILNDSQNHALSLEEEDVPLGHKPSESWQPSNDTGDTILKDSQNHALSLEEEDVPSGHKPSESWQPSNDTGDTILKDSQNHALSLEEEDVPSGHKPSESWQPTNDTGDTILNYTQSHALSLEEEDVPSGHKPSESWQPSNDNGDTSQTEADYMYNPTNLDLPLKPQDLEGLSSLADASFSVSHKDSLEASPITIDNSSRKSPDSIESSPTKESPCRDSLETSPMQQKSTAINELSVDPLLFEVHLLPDKIQYEGSVVKDHSFEQTTQMEGESSHCHNVIICEKESYDIIHKPSDLQSQSSPTNTTTTLTALKPESDSECTELQKQFTPEEEMFKMATKVKTFNEMEKDAKSEQDAIKEDLTPVTTEIVEDRSHHIGVVSPDEKLLEMENKNFMGPVMSAEHFVEVEPQSPVSPQEHVDSFETKELYPIDISSESREETEVEGSEAVETVSSSIPSLENTGHQSGTAENKQDENCIEHIRTTSTDEGLHRELNSFMFQEGKLFEMTRGGAIDMTQRSFEEEVFGIGFLHIDKYPAEEGLVEENKEDTVEWNTVNDLSVVDGAEKSHKPVSDSQGCGHDQFEESGISSSENIDWDSAADTFPHTQRLLSITTKSVHAKQDAESLDPSPKEQQTVIGLPSLADETVVPLCSQVADTSENMNQFLSPMHSPHLVSPWSLDLQEKGRPSSETPVKVEPLKCKSCSDTEVQYTESLKVRKEHLSALQGHRSKSDSDTVSFKGFFKTQNEYEKDYSQEIGTEDGLRQSEDSSDKLNTLVSQQSIRTEPGLKFSLSTSDGEPAFENTSSIKARQTSTPEQGSVSDDVFLMRSRESSVQIRTISGENATRQHEVDAQGDPERNEERLAVIADHLGFSWAELARELEFDEDRIQQIRVENPNSLQEQSHALLKHWAEREGDNATESNLNRKLTKINRMDIVHLIETNVFKCNQTSRTYAEIEKTLDQSEDLDSPRLIRRTETTPKPPPSVSEEDLSVSSLLDTHCTEALRHTQRQTHQQDQQMTRVMGVMGGVPLTFEENGTSETGGRSTPEQISSELYMEKTLISSESKDSLDRLGEDSDFAKTPAQACQGSPCISQTAERQFVLSGSSLTSFDHIEELEMNDDASEYAPVDLNLMSSVPEPSVNLIGGPTQINQGSSELATENTEACPGAWIISRDFREESSHFEETCYEFNQNKMSCKPLSEVEPEFLVESLPEDTLVMEEALDLKSTSSAFTSFTNGAELLNSVETQSRCSSHNLFEKETTIIKSVSDDEKYPTTFEFEQPCPETTVANQMFLPESSVLDVLSEMTHDSESADIPPLPSPSKDITSESISRPLTCSESSSEPLQIIPEVLREINEDDDKLQNSPVQVSPTINQSSLDFEQISCKTQSGYSPELLESEETEETQYGPSSPLQDIRVSVDLSSGSPFAREDLTDSSQVAPDIQSTPEISPVSLQMTVDEKPDLQASQQCCLEQSEASNFVDSADVFVSSTPIQIECDTTELEIIPVSTEAIPVSNQIVQKSLSDTELHDPDSLELAVEDSLASSKINLNPPDFERLLSEDNGNLQNSFLCVSPKIDESSPDFEQTFSALETQALNVKVKEPNKTHSQSSYSPVIDMKPDFDLSPVSPVFTESPSEPSQVSLKLLSDTDQNVHEISGSAMDAPGTPPNSSDCEETLPEWNYLQTQINSNTDKPKEMNSQSSCSSLDREPIDVCPMSNESTSQSRLVTSDVLHSAHMQFQSPPGMAQRRQSESQKSSDILVSLRSLSYDLDQSTRVLNSVSRSLADGELNIKSDDHCESLIEPSQVQHDVLIDANADDRQPPESFIGDISVSPKTRITSTDFKSPGVETTPTRFSPELTEFRKSPSQSSPSIFLGKEHPANLSTEPSLFSECHADQSQVFNFDKCSPIVDQPALMLESGHISCEISEATCGSAADRCDPSSPLQVENVLMDVTPISPSSSESPSEPSQVTSKLVRKSLSGQGSPEDVSQDMSGSQKILPTSSELEKTGDVFSEEFEECEEDAALLPLPDTGTPTELNPVSPGLNESLSEASQSAYDLCREENQDSETSIESVNKNIPKSPKCLAEKYAASEVTHTVFTSESSSSSSLANFTLSPTVRPDYDILQDFTYSAEPTEQVTAEEFEGEVNLDDEYIEQAAQTLGKSYLFQLGGSTACSLTSQVTKTNNASSCKAPEVRRAVHSLSASADFSRASGDSDPAYTEWFSGHCEVQTKGLKSGRAHSAGDGIGCSFTPSSQDSLHTEQIQISSTDAALLTAGTGKAHSSSSEDYWDAHEPHEVGHPVMEEVPPPRDSGACQPGIDPTSQLSAGEQAECEDDADSLARVDAMLDVSPLTEAEQQAMEHCRTSGVSRKIIQKGLSADGVEWEEEVKNGQGLKPACIKDGAQCTTMRKRALRSDGDQTEVTFCESLPLSTEVAMEAEPEQEHSVNKDTDE
ncbi:ankyrin-2-like isoform X2 [Brienomyrus brachyistius]|uniref:ankyrin-2-like isoform X2 n=1 Tax=Brienomyrus brachyistius TaxID=42636 RepID=UPI0020B413C0|nr:ankyrin-2-like isoform X2 [Brienomyrus brachyistius]